MIKIGILGITGYTGIELVRVLSRHPKASLTRCWSHQHAGASLASVYPHLKAVGEIILEAFKPTEDLSGIDVLFCALPHGEVQKYMSQIITTNPSLKIIDLSADFRLSSSDDYQTVYNVEHQSPEFLDQFVMGIPELYRDKINGSTYCANPGCYAIASILGAYPIADTIGINTPLVIDAKSGVSGAGKGLTDTTHFCQANESISAYATGEHRHLIEIESELNTSQVIFSPHLIPQNRGELCTIYVENTGKLTQDKLTELYHSYYDKEPFVTCVEASPSTGDVIGSNMCMIYPKLIEAKNTIVIVSVIDNLMKGASGQAVQNMNIMCGLAEDEGMPIVGHYL